MYEQTNNKKLSFRKFKNLIRDDLKKHDFDFLNKLDYSAVYRALNSLIFDSDQLVIRRALEAMGRLSAMIFANDPDQIREYLRRFFWMMNDESGSLCWKAPEAVGEILYNNPTLIKEYGPLLASFVVEEPFEIGVRLALGRIFEHEINLMLFNVQDKIIESLNDDDVQMRGASVIALRAMKIKIPTAMIEELKGDDAVFDHYNFSTGNIDSVKISDSIKICEQ